jgi:protein ImuB
LRRLFAGRLERIDPGFGLDGLSLEARETKPWARRLQPLPHTRPETGVDEEALGALLDRLNIRLGDGAAVMALPGSSHLPERAVRLTGYADPAARRVWRDAAPSPLRPLLTFDPAETVEVLAEVPDGPPLRFAWRGVSRRVVRATGAERIAPEWWTCWPDTASPGSRTRTRDFYQVEDAEGRRYWLAREGLYGDGRGGPPVWRIHGLFG